MMISEKKQKKTKKQTSWPSQSSLFVNRTFCFKQETNSIDNYILGESPILSMQYTILTL